MSEHKKFNPGDVVQFRCDLQSVIGDFEGDVYAEVVEDSDIPHCYIIKLYERPINTSGLSGYNVDNNTFVSHVSYLSLVSSPIENTDIDVSNISELF